MIEMVVAEEGKEIRRAVDTGKVAFGYRQSQKELLKGEGELIVTCSNIPKNEKETLDHLANVEGKKVFEIKKTGLELGKICGKPFVVSAMIILDKGKSNVLELIK